MGQRWRNTWARSQTVAMHDPNTRWEYAGARTRLGQDWDTWHDRDRTGARRQTVAILIPSTDENYDDARRNTGTRLGSGENLGDTGPQHQTRTKAQRRRGIKWEAV